MAQIKLIVEGDPDSLCNFEKRIQVAVDLSGTYIISNRKYGNNQFEEDNEKNV